MLAIRLTACKSDGKVLGTAEVHYVKPLCCFLSCRNSDRCPIYPFYIKSDKSYIHGEKNVLRWSNRKTEPPISIGGSQSKGKVIVFENDIQSRAHFVSKVDTKSSFEDFCKRCYINTEDFPFTIKTGRMFDGREIVFAVRSWGSYEVRDGQWRIFIAYYFPAMKHTVQYTWHVGAGGLPVGKPDKNEWIN